MHGPVEELAILVAIIDTGSFTGAAKRLRYSPPAVTRPLAAVVEHVGTRLIERTTRGLGPTQAGRRFSQRTRALLIEYSDALSEINHEGGSYLARPSGGDSLGGKVVHVQYFGRWEFAHSRACWIGVRGTAARTFCVAGTLSMRSRQRQNAGNFGYMACPSSVRLNANVLGSR